MNNDVNNKKDWEELEQWEQNHEAEEKKNNIDVSRLKNSKMNKAINVATISLKVIGRIIELIALIIIIAGVIILCKKAIVGYRRADSASNVKPQKTIERMYNIKVEKISAKIDKNENGVYNFRLKNNHDIVFTAIKNWGSLSEDYLAQAHKYYFERWSNQYKNKFTVQQKYEDGLLNYDTFIAINDFNDVKNSIKIINDFKNFCGNNFSYAWQIYLAKGTFRIYPYTQANISEDDAIKNSEELYKRYFN